MKRSFLIVMLGACSVLAIAQNKDTKASGDTITTITTTTITSRSKDKTVSIKIGKNGKKDTASVIVRNSRGASFDFTLSRIDLGFAKLIDNGSFTLSPANQFLDYQSAKTSYFGLDIIQLGYRFSRNFKVYVGGGADFTHIRLEKDITILREQPVLNYSIDNIEYDKNRLSSMYLRIPLALDFRTNVSSRGKRLHFVVGPEVGFLVGGKVKQVSDENGKQKFKDDYHFTEFRYGAYARIGVGDGGLFVKQTFSDMFENSPAQKGLKSMSFGIMLGF